jgi:hypothetical protein
LARNCFVLLLCVLLVRTQAVCLPSQVPAATAPSKAVIEQMLSWFPADTETLIGATGPLLMPKMSQAADGAMSLENPEDKPRDAFKQYSLLQLLALMKTFKDEPIVAAIEGSRDFRPPSGLGMAMFQGATIAVFASDTTARAAAFIKDSVPTVIRTERIEGQNVAVFKEKSEEDIWTTYVAFPKRNMAVVATDEGYLREVLARINGKQGERTLPDALPEWKYVNTQAQFWAMRHFRSNVGKASLTSGFSCITSGMKPDEEAIGLAFSFDPDKSKAATVTYLSGDEITLQTIQKSLFNERESGVREMHAQYREVQRGVLEGTYNIEQVESAQYFVFVLEALLGHAIYV